MANPWLSVSLADYEGHMNSVEVQQLGALSDLFAEALAFCRPRSVAILGIAGGNGLDHIDPSITKRGAGLDVNRCYLGTVRERYVHLPGLELYCADLGETVLHLPPVQLVHAALVFEHAGVGQCLENTLSLVAPGGALSVVVQLPSENEEPVGPSRIPSIQNLKSRFSLVDSAWLCKTLEGRRFRLTYQTGRSLPAGKGFWMGIYAQA
jgi:hypothetical protein